MSFFDIIIDRSTVIGRTDFFTPQSQTVVNVIDGNGSLLNLVRGDVHFCQVGEGIEHQINKDNDKNDHSDIDIQRFSIFYDIFILFQKNVFIRAETRIVYVWFILWESEAPVISMECEQDVMRLPLFGLFSHPQ